MNVNWDINIVDGLGRTESEDFRIVSNESRTFVSGKHQNAFPGEMTSEMGTMTRIYAFRAKVTLLYPHDRMIVQKKWRKVRSWEVCAD